VPDHGIAVGAGQDDLLRFDLRVRAVADEAVLAGGGERRNRE
jgi:hypothetical protein